MLNSPRALSRRLQAAEGFREGPLPNRIIQRFAGSFNFHAIRLLNSHLKKSAKLAEPRWVFLADLADAAL
jgi:hypothetical protein